MSDSFRNDEPRKRGLGRGLSALLADDEEEEVTEPAAAMGSGAQEVPIEFLQPNRYQPRQRFPEEAQADLVESIKAKGVLQPILVRALPDSHNQYEIIAGERRWRAAQKAQCHTVPIVVRDLDDAEALEVALIENIQRRDLTPIEEALGYQRLMDEFGHTQEQLGRVVGKSRSHIANALRLLGLPQDVRDLVDAGEISAGHARALVTASNASDLAKSIVARGLSVRQVEKLVKKANLDGSDKPAKAVKPAGGDSEKDADTLALENELEQSLGMVVAVAHDGEEGTVTVNYTSLEQLDEICRRLTLGTHG